MYMSKEYDGSKKTMATENEVFRKIKEISTRAVHPRPLINTGEVAHELGLSREHLMPLIAQLKQLKLVNVIDPQSSTIRLTLLGTVVKREK